MAELPLDGLRLVVCRPEEQAAPLADRLEAAGAHVVHAPVIAIADPVDGGAELAGALGSLTGGDWLVLTSPNGAARAARALVDPLPSGVMVAVVGPGTAERARAEGLPVDLASDPAVAEGLLEVFPPPSGDGGRVVLARAAVARDVLPEGLREMGWNVTDVAAYQTLGKDLSEDQRRAAAAADGVIFTSSSTVDRLVDQLGGEAVPVLVVSIGPATSATARSHDLDVTVEATDHTIPGVVEALVAHAHSWGRDRA